METIVIARAKPFHNERLGPYRFMVSSGVRGVRVWDSVAEHYTYCHGLSRAAELRIRKLASSRKGTK